MWELDYKESWALKNWHFLTVVLEKTLESPLDCKEIQPVHLEGDQSWVFIGRTNAEAETPILWPPHVKSWLIGKDPDAGKDWGQEEKGMTEDEMVGWHHWLNGHGFGWTPGVGDGQGGLACCGSRDCKELDTTERLNWTQRTNVGTPRDKRQGGGRGGGINWEIGVDIYTLLCIKQITSESLLYTQGTLLSALCVCLVVQSCPDLFEAMDCSPPGSLVRGDSPGKNIGVGGYVLLQGIVLIQGSNPGFLHCSRICHCLRQQGSPRMWSE